LSPEAVERAAAADAICFTSASTVTGLVEAGGLAATPPTVACIGPVTADAARAAGLEITVVATEHTLDGLVDALGRALERPGAPFR
ncbi:MAG: uroporphyrinogen-III synthase, partial [Acidimicrobiales bacterium]